MSICSGARKGSGAELRVVSRLGEEQVLREVRANGGSGVGQAANRLRRGVCGRDFYGATRSD